MSAWLLQSLATWGLPLLFATTFASCLALPVPASLMMLAAGAFVASGDLPASGVCLAALFGAIAGAQLGYCGRSTGLLAGAAGANPTARAQWQT
ncbi:MAG: DedA family protein [Lutimaribacter sp.]